MTVPVSKWRWCGVAGHFVAASRCQFHLHTRVGDYRISTVGAYYPSGSDKMETVGSDRFYETMVFRVSGDGQCGMGVVDEWGELDSDAYNDFRDAEAGHMKMCRKYAKAAA